VYPILIYGIWPFSPEAILIWKYGNAKFTTATGSTNLLDLLNVRPQSQEQAYVLKLNSPDDRIALLCTTTELGFLYLTGSGTATWTQRVPSESSSALGLPNTIKKSVEINANFVTIDLSKVVGSVVFSTTSSSTIQLWSDEYSKPTYGRYVMQPFLEGHSAFSISISSVNNTFKVGPQGSSLKTASISPGLFLNPESFVLSLQAAIDEALGPSSGLTVNLRAYDSENPDLLHVSNLVWESSGPDFTVELPNNDPEKSATAATLGLYEFNTAESATVVNTIEISEGTTPSPGPVFIQWPVTFTLRAFTNPGSANTDGIVRFYPDPQTTVPTLVLAASDTTYEIYGPTSTYGPTKTFITDAKGRTVEADVYFTITAVNATSQSVSAFTIVPKSTDLWTEFLSDSASHAPTLKLNSDAAVSIGSSATLLSHFNGTGIKSSFTGLSSTIAANIVNDLSAIIVLGSYVINTTISFSGLGRKVTRHVVGSEPEYLDSTYVEAWAGGGGTITNSTPINYGGSSSRVSMEISGTIQSLIVDVGTRGVLYANNCTTGGRSTRITINGCTIMHIGGGGGAAAGSNGGCGGGPIGLESLGSDSILTWAGYSASTMPFSPNVDENAQVLGPTTKPVNNIDSLEIIETYQGSGAGPDGSNGLNGFYNNSAGTDMPQQKGGLGGLGYGGTLSHTSIKGSGGTGTFLKMSSGSIYGGGGGGATAIRNTGTITNPHGATIHITDVSINGPWASFGTTRPLGGGLGPYQNPGPGVDYYDPVENFCDNFSLLSILFEQVWTITQQTQFVTGLLVLIVEALGTEASLIVPNTANNLFWPVHDNFVNMPSDSNSQNSPIQSYVPIGPHDLFLPDQNGPNLRPITTDDALLEEGYELCVFNDGQIDIDEGNYLLNTPLSGPEVPFNTSVIGIRLGQSSPKGLYSAIYLRLSSALESAVGPFSWNFASGIDRPTFATSPSVFQNGTPFHVSKLNVPWDTTLQLSTTAPQLASTLTNDIYALMQHVYVQTSQVSLDSKGTYFPTIFTLPSDTADGPSYLDKVWPSAVQLPDPEQLILTTQSTLSVRVFSRPMGAPPQLSNLKHVQTFSYSNSVVDFVVPPFVKAVTVRAFGAGGSSTGFVPGADGSCAIGTFRTLANQNIQIYVGRGGGRTPSVVDVLNGGRSRPSLTGGGGLSGIKLNGQWILVAGGGGQSTDLLAASEVTLVVEALNAGQLGVRTNHIGETSGDSGAGGSGFYGGSAGSTGYPGGSGSSLVPKGGSILGNLEKQKFWTTGIGKGSTNYAGNGLIVFQFFY